MALLWDSDGIERSAACYGNRPNFHYWDIRNLDVLDCVLKVEW